MTEFEKLPVVSIIIPTYNRAELIGETLQSVKNQTYQNWECIVVDDGSTDNTAEIVNNFIKSENRIQFYNRDRSPKGAPTCRNIGLQNSNGKYVIFLDSDDLMSETCLATRVSFFESNPEEDFIVFQTLLFEKEKYDLNILWNIDTEENDLQRFLRIDALWPTCGPIYKKEVLLKVGEFRENLNFWQDFDLHLRFIFLKFKYKKFLNLPPDCFMRQHFDRSISRSIPFINDYEILKQRIEFYFSQLDFIKKNEIYLNVNERKILWSILFYFSTSFLIEHNNKKDYSFYWFKTKKLLGIKFLPHYLSFILPFSIHFQKKSHYFIKISSLYCSFFKRIIADYKITSNTTMGKIKGNNIKYDSNLPHCPLSSTIPPYR